ncbi:MAG TPA: hypothetical protein VN026_13595 [Bacteroidia bacterium]|jgi:hypothetical protein|nr:hypothetical protein [Bacteroidia bacterium]
MEGKYSVIITTGLLILGGIALYAIAVSAEKEYIITRLLREDGDTPENRAKFSAQSVSELKDLMRKRMLNIK